jgi:toxin YoeB
MVLTFTENAWEDYTYWQKIDKKIIKKINQLIKDIQRNPFDGIGKPEPLKYDLAGYWSRRIDHEHRLVYQVIENELEVMFEIATPDGALGACVSAAT